MDMLLFIGILDWRNLMQSLFFVFGYWRIRPIDKLVRTGLCRFRPCQLLWSYESQSFFINKDRRNYSVVVNVCSNYNRQTHFRYSKWHFDKLNVKFILNKQCYKKQFKNRSAKKNDLTFSNRDIDKISFWRPLTIPT